MKIYRSLEEVPADFGPSALSIGNFDGVHYGHRRILRRLVELSRAHAWKASVLTFHPHPAKIVAPEHSPPLMTTPEQRADLMGEEGIEQVLILPFTAELARFSPEEFVYELLVRRLDARMVLVGANFRFGYRRAGDVELLGKLGQQYGFQTEIVGTVSCRGRIVSSSGVRELIREGNVSLASRLLLRPYALEGSVVKGRGVGAKQTVPTLNLATSAEVIPARGVYITRTRDLERARQWKSVTNIGYRPTFGASEELSIETFLLDPLAGEAPRLIRLEFLRRLRDERQFQSPEELKSQIMRDVRTAETYFRRLQAWSEQAPCISS
jgi:riboflavin kinase/FMN adenylyltransferase